MAAIDNQQSIESSLGACVSCGSKLAGIFCSACGEKNAQLRHYGIGHFLTESLEHLTHADSTFLRTLRLLLFKPGALTALFMSGQRKNHLGPMQLFFVLNLIFFILQSFFWTGPLSVPLEAQINLMPFKSFIRAMVDNKVAARMEKDKSSDATVVREELQREFDHSIQTAAKSMVIIMVPMFAVILNLLELGRKRFALEHLVFSLHFYSFLMALFSAMLAAFAILFLRTSQPRDERPILAVLLLVISTYLYLGLRRAYRERRVFAFLKAAVLTTGTVLLLHIYRLILAVRVLHSI